jgi:hypothetical protein
MPRHSNVTKFSNGTQGIIESSFYMLDQLYDRHDDRKPYTKLMAKRWYEVRENALNIALNDLLAHSEFDYNEYELTLKLKERQYIVYLNGVLGFEVKPSEIDVDGIRKTVSTIYKYIEDLNS